MSETLRDWNPDYAHSTVKLRKLLCKDTAWCWTPEHEKEFNHIRETLSDPQKLVPLDPELETEVLNDASKLYGLGFFITQPSIDQLWIMCSLTCAGQIQHI